MILRSRGFYLFYKYFRVLFTAISPYPFISWKMILLQNFLGSSGFLEVNSIVQHPQPCLCQTVIYKTFFFSQHENELLD